MPEQISTNSNQMTNPQNQPNISLPTQPPPNNLPPQNSKQPNFKILITLGIVVVIIILLILGSFVFLSQQERKIQDSLETNISPTISLLSPTLSPEEALRAPELYPEFEWEESPLNIPTDDLLLYVDYSPLNISISGSKWNYSTNVSNLNGLHELRQGFDAHYGQEVNRLGWDNAIEYKNKRIQALIADGPAGGTIGYIKTVGDKMRLIMLEDNAIHKGESTNERPFSCPCEISFRVSISDIFSTAELEN